MELEADGTQGSSAVKEADAVELKKSNAKLTSEKSHLEQVLASKVNDIRALKAELQSKEDLQSQVETLQIQVASHKADFEDERRDREAAHSKMADMEKTMVQIEGRTDHEKSALILEIGNLKTDRDVLKEELRKKDQEPGELNRDRDVVREELRKKDQDLQIANEELKKHQRILTDLEKVSQKLTLELQEVKSEHQAKVSQVKQYAKENEKLKKQLEAAIGNINVIAEEMERDRKKAFELQDELEKFNKSVPTKQKKKWKKAYLPDRSEAIETQMTKLEELYNDALREIQSLSGENEELTVQFTNLSQAYDGLKQLWKQQHGRFPATTPTVTQLHQLDQKLRISSTLSSQQRVATCEQPLRAGPTDDIISDDLGTTGAGNFLPGRAIPPSQQLPLRARAPDGPPQGDPNKQSTRPQANPHGMRLPLKSKQEPTGRGDKQSFSPQRQRPFSPKRSAKNPPTVQASGGDDYT